MKTYQDLIELNGDAERAEFVKGCISNYRGSELYRYAKIAKDYASRRNTTIREYQKLLYTITGEAVPDNYSANYKMSSAFFQRFVIQQVQFLLGNGAVWENEETGERLGKSFDSQLQKAAKEALVGSVAYGFWNLDKLEVFSALEFVPLFDETNGALRAGIRFWQIDDNKPLRATLYEEDGYTDFFWDKGEGGFLKNDNGEVIGKRKYIEVVIGSEADIADGTVIYDGENYPTFPIIPLWANSYHQSELVGLREQIDCYDLIKSGYANTIDDASFIYWSIQNAGGMEDIDLVKFVERMKTMHAAITDDAGSHAEPVMVNAPHDGRDSLLALLRRDLYDDAMALDTKTIQGGAITATQIKAAYEPLNSKTDEFEYQVIDFCEGILRVLGIEGDEPTFQRSYIINTSEELQNVLMAATVLTPDYVTEKVLNILGDGDRAEELVAQRDADAINMLMAGAETSEAE